MKKTLLILCAALAIGGRTALAQEKMDTRTVETGHLSGVEARNERHKFESNFIDFNFI